MKRFHLTTLVLLVIIAALGMALLMQEIRHRLQFAELERRLTVKYFEDLEDMNIRSKRRLDAAWRAAIGAARVGKQAGATR
jgi:hypothetical protein